MTLLQDKMPGRYEQLTDQELCAGVAKRKEELGRSLVILGHHYQTDEVVRFADFVGDSLKLSQLAAQQNDARYIVFCGVHFMAESADILSAPEQVVCLPNMLAGCTMADMADAPAVATAIEELSRMTSQRTIPVTYVNSSAAVKAITGRSGGACCTSGNVLNVFRWALAPVEQGGGGAEKILSIPDEHLGRNTAVAMGYRTEDCVVYDPSLPNGGLTEQTVRGAKFILWKGSCYVHQFFTVEQIRQVRVKYPGIRVIVHPECTHEVVIAADAFGSTEQIIKEVQESPPGSMWAIGTEGAMVQRLAASCPGRFIRLLSDIPATCFQMKKIDLPHLLWVLDNLATGKIVNQVSVPSEIASGAIIALDRMIQIRRVDLAGGKLRTNRPDLASGGSEA